MLKLNTYIIFEFLKKHHLALFQLFGIYIDQEHYIFFQHLTDQSVHKKNWLISFIAKHN